MRARSFGTHDGSFHADEVTACSLLLLYDQIDAEKVYRTRETEVLNECEYVCDVGGEYCPEHKRFDHHQSHYRGPLSSAGMVCLDLKESGVVSTAFYDYLNQTLMMGVDAHDNGTAHIEVGTTSFSQVIANFLPIEYEASSEEITRSFWDAVRFVISYLERLQKRHRYIMECREIVRQQMNGGGKVLFFDLPIPWMESFFEMGGEEHPAQFIIMPTGSHWKLRGIPPNMAERMKVRTPLPESWAGLHDDDLQSVCGIAGAIFCHKGRFISVWKTRSDALRALNMVLEQG